MDIMNKHKKRLLAELENREYRDAYVSSSIDVGIAFQIRALREQVPWTQAELAEKVNMKQERISVLENPSRSPTISTLKRLANAFDIGLIIRFVPISDLVEWELNLSSNSLKVPGYNDDSYFKEYTNEEVSNNLLQEMGHISRKENTINIDEWRKIEEIPIKEALDSKQKETKTQLGEVAQNLIRGMASGGNL